MIAIKALCNTSFSVKKNKKFTIKYKNNITLAIKF